MEHILNEIKQFDLDYPTQSNFSHKLLPGKYIKYTNNYFESNITFFIIDVNDDYSNYQILKPDTIIYKINGDFNYSNIIDIYYNFCLGHSINLTNLTNSNNLTKFNNKRICLKKNYIGLKNIAYSIYLIRIEHDNNYNFGSNRFCLNGNFDKFAFVQKYLDNKINNLVTIYYNLV